MRLGCIYIFLSCACFFLLPKHTFSQGQASYWYFGQNAGLQFDGSGATAIGDGRLSTLEGCATISSPTGELLFYTDGVTVWNRNHEIMENGTGLRGNESSTQSAIIVKQPGREFIYFIFTVDAVETNSLGLNYTTVDMSLQNGNGEVIEKNTLLANNCIERLTAVNHANGDDIWVLAYQRRGSDDYIIAHLVTNAGVDEDSRESLFVSDLAGRKGYMKVSPDGEKIAVAAERRNFDETPNTHVYVAEFDNSTGTTSNMLRIPYDSPYGIEFSPDGTKLYVASRGWRLVTPGVVNISQFDISNFETFAIRNSEVVIGTKELITEYGFGALQLAPDNRIYIAKHEERSLAAILQPDEPGFASTFLEFAIGLESECRVGLPPFNVSLFTNGFTFSNICLGDITQFNSFNTFQPLTYSWDFGDPASGDNNTSTQQNPTHQFSAPGTYTVTYTSSDGIESSTSSLDVTIYDYFPPSRFELESCDLQDGLFLYGSQLGLQQGLPVNGGLEIRVFPTMQDLENQTNELSFPFVFQSNNQVFAQVSAPGGNCLSVSEVSLTNCEELNPCNPLFPTAFSPNGDGINDRFTIQTDNACRVNLIEFRVFDRWGGLVYDFAQTELPWDGSSDGQTINNSYMYEASYTLESDPLTVLSTSGIVHVIN